MEVFSIIIPVYNRPEEIDDLLNSLTRQTYVHFEVIVVDDGSSIPCEPVVNAYNDRLRIRYFYIENSGPGLARNQGVRYAEGEIVIVLDSDCIVPASYLEQVHESLMRYKVDAFGGADRAHSSFSAIQKAVNYSMTSFFTTGGIRGSRRHLDTFYPRSFNMGMRKEVYEALGGFSDMRYGEDIDFSIRIVLRQIIHQPTKGRTEIIKVRFAPTGILIVADGGFCPTVVSAAKNQKDIGIAQIIHAGDERTV